MPVTAEANPINEARAMIMFAESADTLNSYSALRDAVEQKQLSDEIQKLGDMPTLGDDEARKTQFAMLCRARGRQVGLSFADSPLSPCNVLYFNIAKSLYHEATFQTIFSILLPEVTTQWIAECNDDLDIDLVQFKKKLVADHHNNPLVTLPVELDTFRRLVILDNEVFLLDPLAFFNFDLHCQLSRILSETNRPLQQAIAAHNNALAELYGAIETTQGKGFTPLSDSEQTELAIRYTGLGRAPLLDLNRGLTSRSLPVELIRPFYKQVVIPSFEQLQGILCALPPTEYALFLREASCQFNVAEQLHDLVNNLDALEAVTPKEPPVTSSIEDHSFYVKCLAGIAMVAGAGYVIKEILQSKPDPSPLGTGLLVSAAALVGYGLFSTQNSGGASETLELLKQPVESAQALSQ